MSHYVFSINNVAVCDLPLDSATLNLRAGGPDTLSLSYAVADATDHIYTYGQAIVVTVKTYSDADILESTTVLFSGRISRRQGIGIGESDSLSYEAVNAWGDMRKSPLTQLWKSRPIDGGALTTVEVPRVLLGQDDDGSLMDSGEVISFIINRAASKGANVTLGTISAGLAIPTTEVLDTSCDQALRQILNFHPDYVAWIEGTAFNCKPPSLLSTVTVPSACADGLVTTLVPQEDEAPVGVKIIFERTHIIDGQSLIERIAQTAGLSSGWPPPLYMTIPLAGANVTYKTQVIESRTLPPVDDLNGTTSKAFYKGLIPQIAGVDNADFAITSQTVLFADPLLDYIAEAGSETVNPNSAPIDREGDLETDFPRMLVSGQITDWMDEDLKQYDAILTARLYYRGTDPVISDFVGNYLEISEPIQITNALPKTYSEIDGYTEAEEPIAGLATSYWNAIKTARIEGTIAGDLGGKYVDIRPGRKLIVTDILPTAAVVTSSQINLLTDQFQSTFGGSEYLNPKSLTELARALVKNRPTWKKATERTEAKTGAGLGAIKEGSKPAEKWGGPRSTKAPAHPWSLDVVNYSSGEVKLLHGTVRDTSGTTSGALSPANENETFTPSAGGFLTLQLEGYTPTQYTIVYSANWPVTDDLEVEYTGTPGGEDFEYVESHYPLWEFTSTPTKGAVEISEDLYAIHRGAKSHFGTEFQYYKVESTGELFFALRIIQAPEVIA